LIVEIEVILNFIIYSSMVWNFAINIYYNKKWSYFHLRRISVISISILGKSYDITQQIS
jgi:hypothetical protein